MKPLSFDATTAREVTGDTAARAIEEKARCDADAQTFSPPPPGGATYWGRVQAQMLAVVYREQFTKRLARTQRKQMAGLSAPHSERQRHGA